MADTSVTAQAVIDSSIARAKDPNKSQWADAQLLIFLNKAYDYVHKLLIKLQSELVVTSASVNMVATTQEYELATSLPDFWGMADNGVFFAGLGIPLDPVAYEDKIRTKSTVTSTSMPAPTMYYVTATHLGVIPIPAVASVTSYPALTCRYFKANTALALGTAMPYKNLFNEPIAVFMDHAALIKTSENTGELTALYNALETSTLDIAKRRSPT